MILTITQAGLARETDSLTTGNMPKFDKLVIGSGAPHATPFLATAMVQSAFETQVIVVERLSAGAVKFHAAIPSDIEVNIREIGLFLEDGTLYAYADYSQGTGQSFFKGTGFAFSFFVLLTREQLPNLVFTYVPVDTASIALTISQNASSAIDLHIQDYLLNQYTAADVLTKIKTVDGAGSGLDADLLDGSQGADYAKLASPSLTGVPTAPTAAVATNTTQIATTAFVETATTPSQLLTDIKTVDGASSGLDADLLRGLPADFTAVKAENGYQKLPSGLIIQWGTVAEMAGGSSTVVTHTIAFPVARIAVWVQTQVASDSTTPIVLATAPAPGGQQFTVRNRSTVGSGTSPWYAIGY